MTDARTRWKGAFGRDYTARNTLSDAALEALWRERYGTTRSALNREFVGDLAVASALEVGCNVGMQLRLLRDLWPARLAGVDLQPEALRAAKTAVPSAELVEGDARALPFADGSFDLVFTSAVLIHVPPPDLSRVMDEMFRVSCRWIWGLEYWSESPREVVYRGETGMLWKRDFRAAWQERFPTLRLVRERLLPYRNEAGLCDVMYLLEKA